MCVVPCTGIANGNELEQGLQKCFTYCVNLRKIGSAPSIIKRRHFGNAAGVSLSMPPEELCTGLQRPTATEETTSHVPEGTVKTTKVSGARCLSILSAAAGAVRRALQAIRADPNGLQTPTVCRHKLLLSHSICSISRCKIRVCACRRLCTDGVKLETCAHRQCRLWWRQSQVCDGQWDASYDTCCQCDSRS